MDRKIEYLQQNRLKISTIIQRNIKWAPVLNALGLDKKHYELVSSYAEQHAKLENDFSKPAPTISVSDEFDSVLPMSLRILQKLLENNVKIKISDKPLDTITTFRVIIDSEYPSYINIKQHYEHLAIEEIVKLLTEKSNKGKIIIYKLIDRIETNKQTRYVTFYSNIKIITRKDKLNRILKND